MADHSTTEQADSGGAGHPVPVHEGEGGDHPLVGGRGKSFDGQPAIESVGGMVMPALGLGTYKLAPAEARTMVTQAIELGCRHIDTAQMYRNEDGVGLGIVDAGVDRDELFITTKIDDHNHEPADLVRSFDRSLVDLGTDYVDLLLIHWPVRWDIISATLATLAQVQASGRAHHIGVSNFTIDQLEQIKDLAPLEALQVECHVYLQQREPRRWCAENNWAFTAYTPLVRGAVFSDDTMLDIAGSHGATAGQVALAWLLAQPGVSAIPRTSSPEHLVDNWAAHRLSLTADDLRRLDQLDRGDRRVDPEGAPWR